VEQTEVILNNQMEEQTRGRWNGNPSLSCGTYL